MKKPKYKKPKPTVLYQDSFTFFGEYFYKNNAPDFPLRLVHYPDPISFPVTIEGFIKGKWIKVELKPEVENEFLRSTMYHLCRCLSAHGCKRVFNKKPCIELHDEPMFGD